MFPVFEKEKMDMQKTTTGTPTTTTTTTTNAVPPTATTVGEPGSIAEALMRLLESQTDALQLAGTPGPREQSLLSVLEAEEARLAREHAEQRARLIAGFAPSLRAAIDADSEERSRRRAEELRGLVSLVTPLAAVFGAGGGISVGVGVGVGVGTPGSTRTPSRAADAAAVPTIIEREA
jgi:hypothetical protein